MILAAVTTALTLLARRRRPWPPPVGRPGTSARRPSSRGVRTRRGFLRSGVEMLLVGSLAAVVAFGIGAFASTFA